MLLAFISKHGFRLNRPFARYSSASSTGFQPSLKLVAELRKSTTASIQKSREALIAANGDVTAALQWLEKDRAITGQQKAEKLGSRETREGLIGVSVLSTGSKREEASPFGVRAAIIELNCETDFVSKNELFRKLTQDLAFTAALLSNSPPAPNEDSYADTDFITALNLASFQYAPLLVRNQPPTEHLKQLKVSEAIRDLIIAVGENITIRRVASFIHQPIPVTTGVGLRLAHYVHGPSSNSALSDPQQVIEVQGRIGALAAIGIVTTPSERLRELFENPDFEKDLNKLERALARQIVGMNPTSVEDLLKQPFDMLIGSGGQAIESVLRNWTLERKMVEIQDTSAIQPTQFIRWEAGEVLSEESL